MNVRSTTRFLFGFLVAALVALVTACSGGDDKETPTPAPTSPASIAPSPTATPPPATSTTVAPPAKLGSYTNAAITQKDPTFTALPGAKAEFGLIGKAAYQIETPANWNGSLVLYVHGFVGFGTEVAVQQPPNGMREVFIAQGYAWAASSFSENGYAPGIGADDTRALKQLFVERHGAPKRTYLVGESMGGNAIALLLEYYPNDYDGAFAACGALWGVDQIDYLISWAMLAEYFSGLKLPIGEGAEKMGAVLLTELPKVLGTADQPTEKGLQFIDALRNLSGGPRPFFREGYKDRSVSNLGLLLLDPNRELVMARAATNSGATYHVDPALGVSDAALNAGVQRLAADPAFRDAKAHPDAVPTTGKISKPLLTIHGTGDLFVPITAEKVYRQRVEAAGAGQFLVQRAIRSFGHCKFSPEELQTGFADLVAWVEQGKKPAGEDLTGSLLDVGKQFTAPVRANDPGTR